MKLFITFCLVTLFATNTYAQEKELEVFKKEINLYIDLLLGRVDSLPLNKANQIKVNKRVDEAFRKFVAHKGSYNYDKYVAAKGDTTTKFIVLDGRVSVNVKTFWVNSKVYAVFSYTSRDKRNYCIKENEGNSIVYEGNGTCCYIDHLYAIDDAHFLLVEEVGDGNTSRDATVLSSVKKTWTQIKAFEGNAFGQVPGEYFTKKFVKKRAKFQLECERDVYFTAPKDANNILFDAKTKTLSYKQYIDNRKFKLVTAKWENGTFIIDDYNVGEALSSNGVAVPQ